jgi:predicted metalloprotease with PDZ domain
MLEKSHNIFVPESSQVALPAPRDIAYTGPITIEVDATDIDRRIFTVRQHIPVDGSGELTLLYPKWLPGYHSPQAPIALLGGLRFFIGEEALAWQRHPTEVTAFSVTVPYDAQEVTAQFQFLSPTSNDQGDVVVGENLLVLNWNAVVLYPSGYFSRRISVEPSVTLPDGWQWGCALEPAQQTGGTVKFRPVALDVLIDSPLMAGRHFSTHDLDEQGQVRLHLAGDAPELVQPSADQLAPHRELVRQCDRLFGARHFNRFHFLVALTDDLPSNGVEHHCSCQAISVPNYFSDWEKTFVRRDTLPHEYIHSWNGKFRRGADSWTPSFDQPIRSSLMWVYEGQTQYWDRVLCARSGLWSPEIARQALADTAAMHDVRAGSRWRPTSDTTRDPIITERSPLPWPSWQRSEDYYTEGALIWLDVDTRIRELTQDQHSLDDFARDFFGGQDGERQTSTYTFAEVMDALHRVAPFDWRGFFEDVLYRPHADAPLGGLERGGYRLVYRDEPSEYYRGREQVFGSLDLTYSLGLKVSAKGQIMEVTWESPAFEARLITGAQILTVNGEDYSNDRLKECVASEQMVELQVAVGKRKRTAAIPSQGHRYPDLEPIEGARRRLDEILAPLP